MVAGGLGGLEVERASEDAGGAGGAEDAPGTSEGAGGAEVGCVSTDDGGGGTTTGGAALELIQLELQLETVTAVDAVVGDGGEIGLAGDGVETTAVVEHGTVTVYVLVMVPVVYWETTVVMLASLEELSGIGLAGLPPDEIGNGAEPSSG